MKKPLIIMSAPNGARRQKSDHSAIPITPDDMADCAESIVENGASILHLHVRDEKNAHSLDVDRYRASISAIKNRVGDQLIIQATTEAVGIYDRYQQMDMVKILKPEAVSIALRELCPNDEALSEFSAFTKWMAGENIFPQYILYDETDYQRFESYRKQGIFQDDMPFTLFVLGSYLGPTPEADVMAEQMKLRTIKAEFPWAVCGFATNEADCISHAAHNRGHIRVGFENNIWRDADHLLDNNSEMIKYSATEAEKARRPVANSDDVRKIFRLE